PPVSTAQRNSSKARDRICAPTRRGSFELRRSEFSCAVRSFSIPEWTTALRRRCRTRRSKSLRTAAYRVRANRAPLENEVGLWFDRAKADRCVQSQQASNREVRPWPALLLPLIRKRSDPDLSRVAAARFPVRRRRSRRGFLRCPREYL